MVLPRYSISLGSDEIDHAVLRSVQLIKRHLVHDHVLLTVCGLENHVFRVCSPCRHLVHLSVPKVHLVPTLSDLLVENTLLFLTILVILKSINLLSCQVSLEQIHVHSS